MKISVFAAFIAVMCLSVPTKAADTCQVVSSCGSATYTAGSPFACTMDTKGNICGSSGGGSGPAPYVATYLGKQTLSAATLATSTALTPPAGATIANFFPECSAGGTDSICIRFNPNGTADASASAGLITSQIYLGETSATFANYQVILATGATGATGSIGTLTVYYYK